jgi:hypothetical protein
MEPKLLAREGVGAGDEMPVLCNFVQKLYLDICLVLVCKGIA